MENEEKWDKNSLRDVFDIENKEMSNKSWWWWFWLFFMKNPENPQRPKQLMILWSTKNDNKINCNNKTIRLNDLSDRKNMDGAVAAWYYDGKEMHHNFLLEKCKLNIENNTLKTETNPRTSFSVNNGQNIVSIGNDFRLISRMRNTHDFEDLDSYEKSIFGEKGYSMMRMNRMDLEGVIKGEEITGSSYFQRVFVNAPAVPWYWGIFHFENGGSLSYYNPHFLGKSIKKDISLYDGNELHEFTTIDVKRIGNGAPNFIISGKEENKEIKFTVKPYSKSSWTFRKKMLRIVPNKLVYNEFPSRITDLHFKDNNKNIEITGNDLGQNVGNSEYTTGFLY